MNDEQTWGMQRVWKEAGRPALGTFVFLRDAASTEIALQAGHDFTILDLEHTPLDLHDAAAHQRAADAMRAPMLVRLPGFDHALLGRLLDLGIAGAVLPHFGTSPDEAVAFVRTLRYAPHGTRPSCSGVRAAGYALRSHADYVQAANRDLVAVGLVEDADVVDRLDELLKIAPVDAVMPGPGDLSVSLGLPGQPQHPRVREVIARIAESARKADRRLGVYLNAPEDYEAVRPFSPSFCVHLFDSKVLALAQRGAVQAVRSAMEAAGA